MIPGQESLRGEQSTIVSVPEKERVLVFVPLKNETGQDHLDYLGKGIIRIMRKSSTPEQVYVEEPSTLFYANPSGISREGKDKRKGPVRLRISSRMEEASKNLLGEGEDLAELASILEADYLVSGIYTGNDQNLKIQFFVYNGQTGQTSSHSLNTTIDDVYRDLSKVAKEIRHGFLSVEQARVTIEVSAGENTTSTESTGSGQSQTGEFRKDSPMVYLDHLYLGRAPVKDRSIAPGTYILSLEQKGYRTLRKKVVIRKNQKNAFRFDLKQRKYKGQLVVTSEPPGASVYLNTRYLGETPYSGSDLEAGVHRVRVSKKGFIDRFAGVEISEKQGSRLHLELSPGDTERFFRDPHYVILDWDHQEVALHSGVLSAFFYGGYWYGRVRATEVRDKGLKLATTASLLNLDQWTLYEFWNLENNEKEVRKYRNFSSISGGMGVVTLIVAGYYLWKGVSLSEKEAGELPSDDGWFFSSLPPGGSTADPFSVPHSGSTGLLQEKEQGISGGFTLHF